jgi:heme-binding protein
MTKRLMQAAIVIAVIFVAAQFFRPDRTNPPTDPSHTIAAHEGARSQLVAVLDRACGDCHSNATVWPWYTQVAPLSWLMSYGVRQGRMAVNFSEWETYSPARQRLMLAEACQDASSGKMPGVYAALHREMQLSSRDIETICAAARHANATAAEVSR